MVNGRLQPLLKRFVEQVEAVDELTVVVLKGHLLVEEALERITTKFVHHGDHLLKADPRFPQLVAMARAMSLDDQDNSMWELVLAVNGLRNQLAHSLEPSKRLQRFDQLKALYASQIPNEHAEVLLAADLPDHKIATYAVAMCLGFLDSFEAEVERFRSVVNKMDKVLNPHRRK